MLLTRIAHSLTMWATWASHTITNVCKINFAITNRYTKCPKNIDIRLSLKILYHCASYWVGQTNVQEILKENWEVR